MYTQQAANVDTICAAIPEIATERCPEMEYQAQAVANKFGRALLRRRRGGMKQNNLQPVKYNCAL